MCGDNGHFSQALQEMKRESKSTDTVLDLTECKIVFEDFLSPIMKHISCDRGDFL